MPTKRDSAELMQLTSIHELDGGVAPKAIPEDTSELIGDNMATDQGIQFIPPQSNNDAKVELGNIGAVPHFVGLGKEELMKYANDPFWVRLRWILFILFWIVWLGMLVGAIAIIVVAPKCSDMTKGLTSVQESGPFYQVDLSKFSSDGALTGLAKQAPYLKKLGFKTIIISQMFESKKTNHDEGISEVVNFTKIHPSFGTMDTFTNITNVLKTFGIKVVLQVIPNHSSLDHKWFVENGPEYYVLKTGAEMNGSTWQSWYSENAWANASRADNLLHLHQFKQGEADLNYKNEKVVTAMNEILEFWFDAGADGFLLSDVSYLVEDLTKLQNQNATKNNAENEGVIEKLIDSSKWKIPEGRKAPFALLDLSDLSVQETMKYSKDQAVPVLTDLRTDLSTNFNASDLYSHFAKDVGSRFVVRRLSGPRFPHLLSVYKNDQNRGYLLAMISLLVNGEVVFYNGDEYNFSDLQQSSPVDPLDVNRPIWNTPREDDVHNYYKSLIELHNSMKNTTSDDTKFHADKGVFAFRRVTPDRKIVVVANVDGGQHEMVNLQEALGVESKTGSVQLVTPGTTAPAKGDIVNMTFAHVELGKSIVFLEVGDAPLKTN